jgi:hypothetical protein
MRKIVRAAPSFPLLVYTYTAGITIVTNITNGNKTANFWQLKGTLSIDFPLSLSLNIICDVLVCNFHVQMETFCVSKLNRLDPEDYGSWISAVAAE